MAQFGDSDGKEVTKIIRGNNFWIRGKEIIAVVGHLLKF